MVDYFELEALIVERLKLIPGLLVESAANLEDKVEFVVDEPTAVVTFGSDVRKDGNDESLLIESNWVVSLLIRAPTENRGPEEGRFLASIMGQLQGWKPGADFYTLQWQSTDPYSYDKGSLREYAMQFSVAHRVSIDAVS